MNTFERLTHAFRKAFGNEEIVITVNTTSNDIEDWDSFTHINLILAIEHEFGIEFKQNEIQRFANVGELANSIEKKLQSLQGNSA
jgi:acyl carrier protein